MYNTIQVFQYTRYIFVVLLSHLDTLLNTDSKTRLGDCMYNLEPNLQL